MEEAAKLCELLFGWLEKREKCAEKLLELAQELENVHQSSNISQVVGAATSVLSIFATALATVFTGGLAGPLSRALGVIGLGMSLYDLIATCEEIVKGNQVTDASKFLCDSASEIPEGKRKLKEQLDAMQYDLKKLVKDLGGYSLSMTENAQNIMNYIMGTCTDNSVVSWLQTLTHQIAFVNLLRFYLERLIYILDDFHKHQGKHIDTVFVAHGRTVAEFMPAGGLVPVPTIHDTILYSLWNCKIDGSAAYSIAQGSINMINRNFGSLARFEPNPLPHH
ncbi:Apolipoprotein L4 [Labeo rohita]|uniref:Apolipoprotein L4 n=1 Tax=Labeo rohita TaxID=84645 RepID=A0ABQ8ME44_LABRO|nr:Apolipoprotein L4 [Labeo rohita]